MGFIRAAGAFSNPVRLVLSKALDPGGIVLYRYGPYRLFSLESRADGVSVRECLDEKAYHEALKRSRPDGEGAYMNIGANIGAFDVAVRDVWGARVKGVAVEANPWTCARLANNIYCNHFETWVINAAVTGKEGTVPVNIGESGPGQSVLHAAMSGGCEVRALPLAAVPSPVPGRDVDLLKIDCEGSEYGILEAATAADLARFKHLVMEVHPPPPGFSRERLIAQTAAKGRFEPLVLSRKKEGGDELVFFKRP
ncbi:MAG: hypothetical protein A3D28_04485 [Omnitrophica bacterium RIFCSPHIGHO2_02_FULL_63_14]|nr:MAG: hypothetical protein A3D28_04485 [Omnitrophica bacterium RIFCSPHIGHO2_02_FULL_63_14]